MKYISKLIDVDLAESVFGGYSDFLEIRLSVTKAFKEAVQKGSLEIILSDDPYNTEIDDDCLSAKNTKEMASSICAYAGHYSWDNDELIFYMNPSSLMDVFNYDGNIIATLNLKIAEIVERKPSL